MFKWLRDLWDNVVNLVQTIYRLFMNWVLNTLEQLVYAFNDFLDTYFAYASLIYVMFYQKSGETIAEFWTSGSNQSQLASLGPAPSSVTKPTRQSADVFCFYN